MLQRYRQKDTGYTEKLRRGVTDPRSVPIARQAAYTEGTAPGYVPFKASDKEKIGKDCKKVEDRGGDRVARHE